MSLATVSVAYWIHSRIFDLALNLGALTEGEAKAQADALGREISIQTRRGEIGPGAGEFLTQQLALVIFNIPRCGPGALVQ